MQRKWIEGGIIAFGAGILFRSFIDLSFSVTLSLFVFAATLALISFFLSEVVKRRFSLAAFLLVAIVAGIARFQLSEPHTSSLASLKDSTVTLEGVVTAEPDIRDTLVFLTVSLESISQSESDIATKDKIRVAADRYPEFSYGDRLRLTGRLVEPENFTTDNGNVFDYRSYLAKDGIFYELFRPKIELVQSGEGSLIMSALLDSKSAFLSATSRVLPEPENGLLAGIILGVKHGIPEELSESFRRSGLVHIIVLSGYNLTIVAYAISAFLRRISLLFPRVIPAFVPQLAGVLGIIAFTLMAGASATAVRAAIMALLVIFAGMLARKYDVTRALALAGFAMVLHNPKVLAFDPSFQLSFLATLGLIYLSPLFKRHLKWVTERFGLREIVAATFATQIFVLPRLVGISGTVSLVGVFANIIVLPFVPLTMFVGALTGFGALVHDFVATPLSFITYFLLHGFVRIAELFAALPLSALAVPDAPAWVYMLAYIPIIWFLFRKHIRV